MKRLTDSLFVALVTAAIAACSTRYSPSLTDIESYIQEDPERALSELVSIKISDSSSRQDKALYSLLLSMALDKNYIDLQSDSIVSPAVVFYSASADPGRRFLSYYYLGRVQENAKEYNKALSSYIEAGKVESKFVSPEYQTRLHTRKGSVYYHQFALDRALEDFEAAMDLSRSLANPAFYISCVLDVAATEEVRGNTERAIALVEDLKGWIDERGLTVPTRYYRFHVFNLLNHPEEGREALSRAFEDYLAVCNARGETHEHPLAAECYLMVGNTNAAASELDQVDTCSLTDLFAAVRYYSALASLQNAQGKYKESLETHKKYEGLLSQADLDVYNNDVRFLEERSRAEIEQTKARHRTEWLMILLLLAFCAIVIAIVLAIKKRALFKAELEEAKAQYGFLQEIAQSSKSYPAEVNRTIEARIQALRPFIDSDKNSIVTGEARKLGNTNKQMDDMLASIGLYYAAAYPKFVSILHDKGLTVEEIGLCCLYITGYSVKELSVNPNSHKLYNINTDIRKKLDIIPNGQKLTTWLRNLFESTTEGE